jgi:hypothetical protein
MARHDEAVKDITGDPGDAVLRSSVVTGDLLALEFGNKKRVGGIYVACCFAERRVRDRSYRVHRPVP